MKVEQRGSRANWFATVTAVRETLYEAKRPLTVAEITELVEGKESTVRTHLKYLEERGRVVRLDEHPARFVHAFWAEKKR